MKKVTIIIPVYNAEKYIRKCVQSCINQTWHNIEILLIDDGSTDASGNLCDQFSLQDERVSVYHKINSGVSETRNLGLEKATGEYITFVDADDWLEKDAVEKLLAVGKEVDFVIAGMHKFDEQGMKVLSTNNPQNLRCATQEQVVSALFDDKSSYNYRGPCAKLYKRDLIIDNNVLFDLDLTYGEDTCFVMQYMEHVHNSVQTDNSIYNYRICNDAEKDKRYQFKNVDYQWENSYILYDASVRLYKNTGLYETFKNKVDALYVERIRSFMYICVGSRCDIKKIIEKLNMVKKEFNISQIKIKSCSHLMDKITLFLCKHKWYRGLYYLFVMKLGIYNDWLLPWKVKIKSCLQTMKTGNDQAE